MTTFDRPEDFPDNPASTFIPGSPPRLGTANHRRRLEDVEFYLRDDGVLERRVQLAPGEIEVCILAHDGRWLEINWREMTFSDFVEKQDRRKLTHDEAGDIVAARKAARLEQDLLAEPEGFVAREPFRGMTEVEWHARRRK